MDTYSQLELGFGDLLTVKETAIALTLAEVTIRKWIEQGKLSYVKLGRAVRVPAGEGAPGA